MVILNCVKCLYNKIINAPTTLILYWVLKHLVLFFNFHIVQKRLYKFGQFLHNYKVDIACPLNILYMLYCTVFYSAHANSKTTHLIHCNHAPTCIAAMILCFVLTLKPNQ